MIDNNIIQSLGVGSGIDTNNLLTQLTEIERSAPQGRIDNRREETQTKISDFGLLSNALSLLQESAQVLVEPEGLFSKSASFTESTALVPTSIDTDAPPGIYNFTVEDIAQSQALAFTEFASVDDQVGEGTITFNFGTWTRDGSDNPTTFTQDTEQDSATITIDSTNNTLEGLRDAINDADFGVQASIVNTGSGYKLSILAASGAGNELEMVVSESGGSPSVTVTVEDDKTFAEQNIRDFITSYNEFLSAVDPLFNVTETTNEDGETENVIGSLANDSLAKSVLSRIRSTIASSIPGLSGSDFTSLTNVGIRTELDGTLSISEEEFSDALENSFEDIQKLFAPLTSSSSPDISVNSYKDSTTAGTYDVAVTTPPSRGYLNGGTIDNGAVVFPNFDSTGKTYTFEVSVNGTASNEISIPTATYADEDELAAAIQSAINSDTALSENNATVSVSYDSSNNRFVMTSAQYGTSSGVNITAASADAGSDLGLSVAAGGGLGFDYRGECHKLYGELFPRLCWRDRRAYRIISLFRWRYRFTGRVFGFNLGRSR